MTLDKIPPQAPYSLNHSSEQLWEITNTGLEASGARLDRIAALPETEWTFEEFIVPLAQDENERLLQSSFVEIYQYVEPEKELRDASRAATEQWYSFASEVTSREDLFRGIEAVKKSQEASGSLNAAESHYLDRLYGTYRRNGVHLDAEKKKTFQTLQQRMEHLAAECRSNLAEDSTGVWFTESELEGVPETYLSRLKRNNEGMRFVGLKQADMEVIMKQAANGTTRERVFIAADNKCPQNVALVDELVECRAQTAVLLGYTSYADYVIQNRMLDVTEVNDFLHNVKDQVADRAGKERAVLMETNRQHLAQQESGETALRMHVWDLDYYSQRTKESLYHFNEEKLSEYFPVQQTVAGLLQIFEQLFGLQFCEFEEDTPIWHEDVRIYSVWNEESMGGDFLGYLYLDLFQRPGKVNSNCNITFAPGFQNTDGTLHHPSVALVASFPPTQPSLLRHDGARECTPLLGPKEKGDHWGAGYVKLHHILGGYAAGYYCYILGTVYSRIMFNARFRRNPLDAAEGRRYRRLVLEKGGSLPELPLLEAFVGGKLDAPKVFGHS
ncbi:hypothetical protein ASPZODRAFT_143788 [Penicilliopsis zonata CBS 506.65]|uniref:Peptidase M3A/M3B catalytic domain-containing protein n=1 Tax=Penicilliopsis zonata CBS 506.65 TaxID=1073090 RepID=A0A1L9SFI9_9EURO|nr:hypothetical protein ASPZODRAFT_143788 [Penicilliopsis zonata CBS 506.65]OJJ45922.1 hypothetical protein ASPZODRAFT_143788 [Penicilliopsis zonata CBS 506.65]